MSAIRTLVVDDEPLARDGVRLRLERDPGFAVVGECGNGIAAVEAILAESPDLVFLDVQMPGLTGFEVVEEVGADAMPPVVFVTAYDEYALRAFEVHALDYVLKPFDDDRFLRAVGRAKERIAERRAGRLGRELQGLLAGLGGAAAEDAAARRAWPDRLVVRDGGKVSFVPVGELERVEADGDYVRLHCRGGATHLIRRTMAQMEARLDPARFVRIHRSSIVALDRVRELRPTFKGEYTVLLHDGTRLPLSRSYRKRFQELLEEPL